MMVMTTEEKEKRGKVCMYRVDGHMTVCTDMLTRSSTFHRRMAYQRCLSLQPGHEGFLWVQET